MARAARFALLMLVLFGALTACREAEQRVTGGRRREVANVGGWRISVTEGRSNWLPCLHVESVEPHGARSSRCQQTVEEVDDVSGPGIHDSGRVRVAAGFADPRVRDIVLTFTAGRVVRGTIVRVDRGAIWYATVPAGQSELRQVTVTASNGKIVSRWECSPTQCDVEPPPAWW